MPTPKIRLGNSLCMQATINKGHGSQPQTCDLLFPEKVLMPKGTMVVLLTGGSSWKGNVNSYKWQVSNDGGETTNVIAYDVRDKLWNYVVAGKVNVIDERTGKVYSGLEVWNIPDEFRQSIDGYDSTVDGYTSAENGYREVPDYLNPLEQFQAYQLPQGYDSSTDYDSTGIRTTPFDPSTAKGVIYPRDLLDWLCSLAGFNTAYDEEALARLTATEGVSWKETMYNVYNIDWQSGVKVAQAIQDVADRLGLIFNPYSEGVGDQLTGSLSTIMDTNFNTIRFNVQGYSSHPDFPWGNSLPYTESQSYGEAVNPDYATGVWILGESDRYEFRNVPLIPAWNENLSSMAWNRREREFFVERELGLIINLNTMEEFNTAVEAYGKPELIESGFLEGVDYEDMTIQDYFNSIPFKVYRIDGMDKVLSEDEYLGLVPIRRTPIEKKLVSNIVKPFIIRGRVCNQDNTKSYTIDGVTDGNVDPVYNPETGGYTYPKIDKNNKCEVMENTGHVVFESYQFKNKSGHIDGEPVLGSDYEADDALRIDITFLLDQYRLFFGTQERVVTKQVPNLYKRYIYTKTEGTVEQQAASEWPVTVSEKTADEIAKDIADVVLGKQPVIKNGEAKYQGICGHEPDGIIRRVTTTLDAQRGIEETITYANDTAEGFEGYYDLQNRVASELRLKAAERKEKEAQLQIKREFAAALSNEKVKTENIHQLVNSYLKYFNQDNWTNILMPESPSDSQCMTPASERFVNQGEPICGILGTQDGKKRIEKVYSGNVQANDGRFMGVNIVENRANPNASSTVYGNNIAVCTKGIAKVRVKGPVVQGESLAIPAGGGHFIVGAGSGVKAKQSTPTGTIATDFNLIIADVGTSDDAIKMFKVVTVYGDYVSCKTWDGTTLGTTKINIAKPYLLRRTPFHGLSRDGISYNYTSNIARTATQGATSESQVIVPSYVANDIIYAAQGVNGGVDVTVSGTKLLWLDINVDGRAWAKVST